jgi:transcription antitermination factor NusG
MGTDRTRYVPDMEPGQRVLVKAGTFQGMQGVVTAFKRNGSEPESITEVRVNVTLPAAAWPVGSCGIAPVLFTNPTVGDLECLA